MTTRTMEQRIVDYLRDQYEPEGIILVGSRADGVARDGSDWDLYVLQNDSKGPTAPVSSPHVFGDQSLDVALTSLPIPEDRIIQVFGPNLQQARILYDTSDTAASIVAAAHRIYQQPRQLTADEIVRRRAQMRRNIETMEARSDEVGPFFESLTFLFYIAHRWWYEVKHARWSQSVHRAMPEIEKEDPEFYADLMTLASDADSKSKIAASRRIEFSLFGDE